MTDDTRARARAGTLQDMKTADIMGQHQFTKIAGGAQTFAMADGCC